MLDAARIFEAGRNYETANRFVAFVAGVYRFGKGAAICKCNPAGDLRGVLTRNKSVPRAAITDPKLLGPLLRAIDVYHGDAIVLAALKLLPLLFTRQCELRKARWAEFKLQDKIWTIPAERTKMRRALRVPLPDQSVEILQTVKRLARSTELVFPSPRLNRQPISDGTLNAGVLWGRASG